MRYLKLFEAFEAQALSKVIKFLTKKVGKNSSNDFKNKLKSLALMRINSINKLLNLI
jgi:hypothetical protein